MYDITWLSLHSNKSFFILIYYNYSIKNKTTQRTINYIKYELLYNTKFYTEKKNEKWIFKEVEDILIKFRLILTKY